MEAILILHDIRSAHNVGSLFRTADAVGISYIYMSSTTPAPIDRFGRYRSDIAKTALGAEKTIPWEHYTDLLVLIEELQMKGYRCVAIEQSPRAVDYKSVVDTGKTAFIVGNEVEGLSDEILKQATLVAEIPMKGEKESLNVSVAAGVALFRILNR